MGDVPTGHTKPQKEMVRKRTESGMSKAMETGALCNTFIAYVFWNPTYKELQGAGHLPEGMKIPDINKFKRALREAKSTMAEIVVKTSQRDKSNPEGPSANAHCYSPNGPDGGASSPDISGSHDGIISIIRDQCSKEEQARQGTGNDNTSHRDISVDDEEMIYNGIIETNPEDSSTTDLDLLEDQTDDTQLNDESALFTVQNVSTPAPEDLALYDTFIQNNLPGSPKSDKIIFSQQVLELMKEFRQILKS
ncbi:hypothetical protein BX600DRAFT_440139 [Xylariales sp. PMI_506]|nr:hypothetical protein BX600DRAFT_440139 [Xylariales sp. PMI_506]